MADMVMKMMMPSMPSVPTPGGGDDDTGMTIEEKKEAAQLQKEELLKAEKARQAKYKKERAIRDGERDGIREKYKIAKKPKEEEEESEEEEDTLGPKKKVEEDDPVAKAKAIAEDKLKDARNMMSNLFKF